MYVYLVQHGVAHAEKDDPARRLTEQGRSEVGKTALFMASCGTPKISSVKHSGKKRAEETARILAAQLMPRPAVQKTDGLQPLDDPAVWAARLKDMDTDCMFVGHLPHLAKLASLLLCGSPDGQMIDFKMGGLVCLGRSDDGLWSVAWMVVPSMLP